MATEDDELRARAKRLVDLRKEEQEPEPSISVAPVSIGPKKRSAGEVAKAAAAPGAATLAIVALLQTLLTSRVSPERVKALEERVEGIETERTNRRLTEYSRDKIENCRSDQQDSYLRQVLPRPDALVGTPPRPWFDVCPEMPPPTTGANPATPPR